MADDYSGITRPYEDTPHTIEHPVSSFDTANVNEISRQGGSPNIGDLQRRYDFGNTFTKLSFQRDPFIHLLVAGKKKKFVSDFKFEYATKRASNTYKRYGYAVGIDVTDGTGGNLSSLTADHKTITITDEIDTWSDAAHADAFNGDDATLSDIGEQDSLAVVYMMGDYKTNGNLGNKIGRSADATLGAIGTKPNWFLSGQVIRIPTGTGSGNLSDYAMARVIDVADFSVVSGNAEETNETFDTLSEGVVLLVKIVRQPDETKRTPSSFSSTVLDVSLGTGVDSLAQKLEPKRSYIAGSAYHELSGYGETWKPQPFSTDYGLTQIFKNTAMMSGRAMATALKFGENPWKNEWADKMAELNWDIGQAGYFGEQFTDSDGVTYTEGIVNYILNNGNTFGLTHSSKTLDDFLEDMSAFNDPRFALSGQVSQVFYCDTPTWNWLAKMGGFAKNNIEMSPNYSMQFSGRGKMAGVSYRQFEVDGQTIKVVRDIHLDGTNVKMIAANMAATNMVALKGNGINRDIAVYPGVKTVRNSGEDYRVDLIQGDIGFEFSAPETHAVWL